MAKLILTETEKKAANYLEWSDDALGKAVKKLALGIADHKGGDAAAYTACATMLACMAADKNASTATMELLGVTDGEKNVGDWKIVISRIAPKVVRICSKEGAYEKN